MQQQGQQQVSTTRIPIWACLVAAGAALITLIATRHGPGLSPDSTNYLSAGMNLASGRGLRTFDGSTLTIFPPGLPVIVALGIKLGVGASWTLRLLNAAAAAGTVLLGFVLLRRHVRSGALIAAITALIAISNHVVTVQYWAFSDPLFVTLSLGLVLVLEHALTTRSTREAMPWVVLAAVITTLAFSFRYSGVALIPIGGLALVVGLRSSGRRRALPAGAIYTALACIGPVAWIVRNESVDGTIFGSRDTSIENVRSTVTSFLTVVGSWMLPRDTSSSVEQVVGALLVLVLGTALVVFAIGAWRNPHDVFRTELVPLVVFASVYALYMVAAELFTSLDVLDDRLLAPLYVPLLILAACLLDRGTVKVPARLRPVGFAAVGLVLAVVLIGQAWSSEEAVHAATLNGIGYGSRTVQTSALAGATGRLPAGAVVYSNDPFALFAATGRQPILISPRAHAYRSARKLSEVGPFVRSASCRPTYLAWYRGKSPDYLVDQRALRRKVVLVPVGTYADGSLSRVEARPGAGAGCA